MNQAKWYYGFEDSFLFCLALEKTGAMYPVWRCLQVKEGVIRLQIGGDFVILRRVHPARARGKGFLSFSHPKSQVGSPSRTCSSARLNVTVVV